MSCSIANTKKTYDRSTLINLRSNDYRISCYTKDLIRKMGIFEVKKPEAYIYNQRLYIPTTPTSPNDHVKTVH